MSYCSGKLWNGFLTEQLELDAELTVKCSNYVGEAIEDARLLGYEGNTFLLVM